MFVEGLKLMVLGMGVVGTFLAVLVVAITLCARILAGATARELAAQTAQAGKGRRPGPAKTAPAAAAAPAAQGDDEKRRVVAVMAAALAAHRAARQH